MALIEACFGDVVYSDDQATMLALLESTLDGLALPGVGHPDESLADPVSRLLSRWDAQVRRSHYIQAEVPTVRIRFALHGLGGWKTVAEALRLLASCGMRVTATIMEDSGTIVTCQGRAGRFTTAAWEPMTADAIAELQADVRRLAHLNATMERFQTSKAAT